MSAADVDFPSDLRSLERDYELIRELGQGGMAAVYLARHRKSDRLVAIKAIRARYLDDPDAIKRFAREARTVAGLDHPNIVRTEAIEQIDDRAVAIIMEHVNGGTVRDRLREFGSLGAEESESILRDVANALGYAHRRGIVHRDVKPENIFLDPRRRRALLSDFGIARKYDSDASITLLGAALGTPQYMSPEQIDGEPVDGRSDIYSLGVLGWELLTGRRPWAGESLYGVIYKQKHEDLPRITSLRPRVPANLLFAIEGALIKDREHRFQSIDEFLDQLTYNPPPLLSQTFPPGAIRPDYEQTVMFRPSAVAEVDAAPAETPAASVDETVTTSVAPELGNADAEALVVVPDETELAPSLVGAGPIVPPSQTSYAPEGFALPDFEPNATAAFELTPRRRRTLQALGLLIPLGVAATSLVVLLGGNSNAGRQRQRTDSLTTSTGSVVGDSTPSRPVAVPASDSTPARVQRPADGTAGVVGGSSVGDSRQATPATRKSVRESGSRPRTTPQPVASSRVASTASIRVDSSRPATVRPPDDATEPPGSTARNDSAERRTSSVSEMDDPFKIPATSRKKSAPEMKAVPSSRCLVGSTPDQQACLAAYVAEGDVALNAAFESLVSELRRVAGTGSGASDPPGVQRVRIEQRAWMSIRDHECPRTPVASAGPFWAQAQASCFTGMAASRASELRDAVKRLRKK